MEIIVVFSEDLSVDRINMANPKYNDGEKKNPPNDKQTNKQTNKQKTYQIKIRKTQQPDIKQSLTTHLAFKITSLHDKLDGLQNKKKKIKKERKMPH